MLTLCLCQLGNDFSYLIGKSWKQQCFFIVAWPDDGTVSTNMIANATESSRTT
jgi:hypothetical protein